MLGLWQNDDLESLEAISQNDEAKRIFLRMAALSQDGRLPQFLTELNYDPEVDEDTKGTITEIASDQSFLLVVEDYVADRNRGTSTSRSRYTAACFGRLAQLVRAPL